MTLGRAAAAVEAARRQRPWDHLSACWSVHHRWRGVRPAVLTGVIGPEHTACRLPSPLPQSSLSAVAAARHRSPSLARRSCPPLAIARRAARRRPQPPTAAAPPPCCRRRYSRYMDRLWLDRALNQQSRQYPTLLPTCILIAGRLFGTGSNFQCRYCR